MFLQDFAITRNGTQNINTFPRYTITGRFQDYDPVTGLLVDIANFTGANAIDFPSELKNRTPEERDFILTTIAQLLLQMKAGLWSP